MAKLEKINKDIEKLKASSGGDNEETSKELGDLKHWKAMYESLLAGMDQNLDGSDATNI